MRTISIRNTTLRTRSLAGPLLLILLASAVTLAIASCGSSEGSTAPAVPAAPAEQSQQGTAARYEFIAANEDLAQHIPCYCGCGPQGHGSLRDCFLAADGSYEQHGAWCHICLEEARDVERLQAEGVTPALIRAYIDAQYSRFGPPTNTP